MLRVGLTGGIGSGKSTVAALFATHGATVIDADDVSRQLVEPDSPALDEIVAQFGRGILSADDTLDRAALRQCVFADPVKRKKLEAILHPRVREEMRRQALCATGSYALLVIPLLFESGFRELVDRVLVVDADVGTRIRRVQARNGLREEEVRKILAAQWEPAQRRALADDVIENDSDRGHLEREVTRLHLKYLALGKTG